MSTAIAIVLAWGLRWLKPETTISEMGNRARAVEGVPWLRAVLRVACTQCLHEGREEEPLQYFHCRAEQWYGAVGATLVSWLPCIQNWYYEGVFPNYRDVNSINWEVEELPQQGQVVLTKMAEVEHCEPVRPLSGRRACLPYGRCDASLVERPAWGEHTVVVPRGFSECPIVLGGTGSELLFQSPLRRSGFFPWRQLSCLVEDSTSYRLACTKETSAILHWSWPSWRMSRWMSRPSVLMTGSRGSSVRRWSQWWGVAQYRKRAAVIPNITAGDVVSSVVGRPFLQHSKRLA